MTDLLLTGAIKHVNVTIVEWHWNITATDRVDTLADLSRGVGAVAKVSRAFQLAEVDDETYLLSRAEFHKTFVCRFVAKINKIVAL